MSEEQVSDIAVSRRMRGLDRAFEILDFLRERRKPARPNEIAVGIGAPKSTAYELVNLLLKLGALEHTDDDGRVYLGRKLYFSARPGALSSTSPASARPISPASLRRRGRRRSSACWTAANIRSP